MSRPGAGSHPNVQRGNSFQHGKQQQQHHHHGGRNNAGSGTNSPRTSNAGHQQNASSPASANANEASVLKELKQLVGQPVRLTLDDGTDETGLLWSYDVGLGIVALEVPRAALEQQQKDSAASGSSVNGGVAHTAVPSTAAAYPTATLSSVKVAAQGGDISGARTSFTIVKLKRVQRIKRLKQVHASESELVRVLESTKPTTVKRDVNVAAAEARERAATSEALKRAAKIGVGVTSLGQSVFDGLNKTLPCRWADQHIIVMDEFVISPDKYDTVTVPNIPTSTLQAIARGEKVAGVADDVGAQVTRWQRVLKVLEGERKKLSAVGQ